MDLKRLMTDQVRSVDEIWSEQQAVPLRFHERAGLRVERRS
jgi:hypothetical protein